MARFMDPYTRLGIKVRKTRKGFRVRYQGKVLLFPTAEALSSWRRVLEAMLPPPSSGEFTMYSGDFTMKAIDKILRREIQISNTLYSSIKESPTWSYAPLIAVPLPAESPEPMTDPSSEHAPGSTPELRNSTR